MTRFVRLKKAIPLFGIAIIGICNATEVSMEKSATGSGPSQWSSDLRLTLHPAFSSTSFNTARCLAIDPTGARLDILHLIFFDERDGNRELYYKRSTNGGATWSPDTRLTND